MRPSKVPAQTRLTDEMIGRLSFVDPGRRPYRVQDDMTTSLWVVVTSKSRTFLVRAERGGRSKDSVIGKSTAGMTVIDARKRAAEVLDAIANGLDHKRIKPKTDGETLLDAWAHFQKAKTAKGRVKSPKTISAYEICLKALKPLHDVPLKILSDDPKRVLELHERITEENGRVMADLVMHVLRACYRKYAASGLGHTTLVAELNPTRAIIWNNAAPKTKHGLGSKGLNKWFTDLLLLENPTRREMHLFTLLTGVRRGDVDANGWVSSGITTMTWADISFLHREVTLQHAKGDKRLLLPLSRAAVRCLVRARAAGRALHPMHAAELVFPGPAGRIPDTREGKRLSPTGHHLRNSFATLAEAAGIGAESYKLKALMGHALDSDITDRYKNASALMPELHEATETISKFIFKHAGRDIDAALTARLRGQLAAFASTAPKVRAA